jgi:hypothetical protein
MNNRGPGRGELCGQASRLRPTLQRDGWQAVGWKNRRRPGTSKVRTASRVGGDGLLSLSKHMQHLEVRITCRPALCLSAQSSLQISIVPQRQE